MAVKVSGFEQGEHTRTAVFALGIGDVVDSMIGAGWVLVLGSVESGRAMVQRPEDGAVMALESVA